VSAPGISVALCTFNGARYVRKQLESILDQTRRPDEIVVADDGSTDGTLEIVAEVAAGAGVPFVVLPSGARLGVTANFARAIAACSGDVVVLSDQDDVWHDDRVADSLAALDADPEALLVHTDARLVDAAGGPLGVDLLEGLRATGNERRELASGSGAFRVHLRRNLATGATVTFRRRLREAAEPFPSAWVHDEWLTILAAAQGGARYLDRATIDYRQHGSNEIGVARGGLGYLIARMLAPRADRYETLATRAALLEERLARLPVPEDVRALARRKARFERARSRYPRVRIARVPAILGGLVRGDYRDLSSQRSMDALRDLLQPA
jgi:glycosyltransferase involved in cell wall biosynthesis